MPTRSWLDGCGVAERMASDVGAARVREEDPLRAVLTVSTGSGSLEQVLEKLDVFGRLRSVSRRENSSRYMHSRSAARCAAFGRPGQWIRQLGFSYRGPSE